MISFKTRQGVKALAAAKTNAMASVTLAFSVMDRRDDCHKFSRPISSY